MLDEEVPLVLGRLAVLRSDDAGGPVQVEHVDELLLLLLQLLDLGLQVGVDALQLLGLLLQILRLLLLLVATLCSSHFVPLPPPLPPLVLLRCRLSLVSRSAGGSLVGPVRAGAGPVGAHVDAEPAGQPLGLDGEPQLLLHDGREVGEVVQGERARRGQAGHQGGAADVGQRGTRVLQHHSGNTQGWMRSARLTGIILGGRAVIEFYYRNYLLFSF